MLSRILILFFISITSAQANCLDMTGTFENQRDYEDVITITQPSCENLEIEGGDLAGKFLLDGFLYELRLTREGWLSYKGEALNDRVHLEIRHMKKVSGVPTIISVKKVMFSAEVTGGLLRETVFYDIRGHHYRKVVLYERR